MSSHRLRTLSCVLGLLLWAILLFPSNSAAQGVCFDDKVAGEIVMALERAKISERQLDVAAAGNAELLQQKEILKGTVKLLESQIVIYKNMIEMQEKTGTIKDKVCDDRVKAATPTFWENLQKYLVGGGVGAALLGLVLIAL